MSRRISNDDGCPEDVKEQANKRGPSRPAPTEEKIEQPFLTEFETGPVIANPVDTPAAFETEKDRYRGQFGRSFRNEEQFEYFMMLPLSETDRAKFIQRVWEHDRNEHSRLKPVSE